MRAELQLRSEIDEYINRRLKDGELLEDVIDSLKRIVKDKTDQWFADNPIKTHS